MTKSVRIGVHAAIGLATLVCLGLPARAGEVSPAPGLASPPRLESVRLDADLDSLPATERAALAKIVQASVLMDALYVRQVWPGTAALVAQPAGPGAALSEAQRSAIALYKGPWLPDGTPFVAGVPRNRLPADFYAVDSSKEEISRWLAGLDPAQREQATGPFTAVSRNGAKGLASLPYRQHYGAELKVAAGLLDEAAALTIEPTLARFLKARARALLTDDYYESDVAFVDLGGRLDVVLGPYEPDDDVWFGRKTAFEASIGIVDVGATRRVAAIASHLQELEDHLPLPPELRGRKLGGTANVVVLDAVYQGGMSAVGGPQAGYGLPNDVRVLESKGARTGVYRNVLRLTYERDDAPIADAVLLPADRVRLRFEDILDEILMVRLFDSLGPQRVAATGRPISEALGDSAVVAGQVRSMVLSLWAHQYLVDRGYLAADQGRSIYSAFLIPALNRLRAGLGGAASRGSTYLLNKLLDAGAFHVDASRHVVIDAARAREAIERTAREFIPLMAAGNEPAVRKLLQRHVGLRPETRALIGKLPPLGADYLPVYAGADALLAR